MFDVVLLQSILYEAKLGVFKTSKADEIVRMWAEVFALK
jgi:hypothetical protein